jgi:two-component system, NtrC family, nitrogen regulation sensor histidine kinase NtrY
MQKGMEFRRKILQFAILCILSFCVAFCIHFFTGQEKDQLQSSRKKLEEGLRVKEERLERILEMVLQSKENARPFENLYKNLPPDLYEEDGISIFLYRNDSLVFWSNNHVHADPQLNQGLFSKPFIYYSNGWSRVLTSRDNNMTAIGLILVKNDFPYQNEFLTNEFQHKFNLPENTLIDTLPGNVNIKADDGNFLFSIYSNSSAEFSTGTNYLILALLMVSMVSFLLLLFYLYHLFGYFTNRPVLLFIAFFIDALFLRFLAIYFEIPGFLYQTDLFGPYLYATSFVSPSLGDLFVNSIFWLTLAWLFYNKFVFSLSSLGKINKYILNFVLAAISGGIYYLLISTLRRMVMDSNVEMNLNNIFNIDLFSGMAFLAITSLVLAFFLSTSRLLRLIASSGITLAGFVLVSLIIAVISVPVFLYGGFSGPVIVYPLLLFTYFLAQWYFSGKPSGFRNISGALVFIVYFSMLATFVLDFYLNQKEKEKRKTLAYELTSRRDPMVEYEFSSARNIMLADTVLKNLVNETMTGKELDEEIISVINEKYFREIRNNYELFFTICRTEEVLIIQPEGYLENCYAYFGGLFKSGMSEEVSLGLFFLDQKMDKNNYIGIIDFLGRHNEHQDTLRVFVEMFYKYFYETGLGYPDLLMDKNAGNTRELADYSYAKYIDDKLVYKNGDFSYHLGFQAYDKPGETTYFIDNEGYNHYIVKLDEVNKLVISTKNPTPLDLAAPFSYLFIIFSLFLLLFLSGYILTGGFSHMEFNFSNQLQVSIIAIVIVSFIVLGFITRSNVISLYNNKNRDNLSEKTFSVLTELEHKLGNEAELTDDMKGMITDYLNKFSSVFFTDINLYDTSGSLISSSRQQIFEENLLSGKMNTSAYYKLAYDESLLYIQNEKIGKQEYLSAYIPFRNNRDQIIAYLNLPYFAKQTELRKEIGDFLAAYINVYVLMIVLAIMVTILVSRFITRPLKLIREKLRNLELGKPNEKIGWKKKDEIGDLVEEYNRMIDELSVSAEMLAKSERESAWREMAKQVAHEIKNPLTPMKLSVQYLQKAWNDKAPDWEKHLSGFTQTIVEQIDSLSEIASAFSDFAKMPTAKLERIEITGIINSATELYQHLENVKIITEGPDNEIHVLADKKQLLRVFNNLLQNAAQAIGKKDEGLIRISVSREGDYCVAAISDNGTGITEEQAKKIFSPSFTTKSSGMGLGLAMVRSILSTFNGTVSFESKPGEGAEFTVKIPVNN